jgi:hypothetical protein
MAHVKVGKRVRRLSAASVNQLRTSTVRYSVLFWVL